MNQKSAPSSQPMEEGSSVNPSSPHSKSPFKNPILIIILIMLIFLTISIYLFISAKSQNNLKVVNVAPSPASSFISPSPTPDPTVNWKTLKTVFGLELKYPNNWYVEQSGSSQFPILRIQNFPTQKIGNDNYNKGEFYFGIQRFPVGNSGIYSIEELKSSLPKSGDSMMYIGSEETVTNYQQEAVNIGPYTGFHRIYGPLASPTVKEEIYYVLSPSGNVIQIEPKQDIQSQKQTFDQILSTFKFLDEPQQSNSISNSNTKIYQSPSLKVSFNYSTQKYNIDETIQIKEVGDKVYVYPSTFKDYTQGQWVQVIPKDKSDSLADAIKKKFLSGYSSSDCFVTSPTKYSFTYPQTYQSAIIDVPYTGNGDLSTILPKWQKCPEPYVSANGISYFLMDTNHPDKFVYFSIGQYPIDAGISDLTWQDTIKFF